MPKGARDRVCEVMLGRKIERNSPAQLSRFLASRLSHASTNEALNAKAEAASAASAESKDGGGGGSGGDMSIASLNAERVPTGEIMDGAKRTKTGYGKSRASSPAPGSLDVDISGWL